MAMLPKTEVTLGGIPPISPTKASNSDILDCWVKSLKPGWVGLIGWIGNNEVCHRALRENGNCRVFFKKKNGVRRLWYYPT